MQDAANCLVGEHDFSSFRAIRCQAKSPVKTIRRLEIVRHGNYVVMEIEANAFLHHMVRNIAGVLIDIGAGGQPVSWCEQVLHYRDRNKAGVTAQASGLYLTGVSYPDQYNIPEQTTGIIIVP